MLGLSKQFDIAPHAPVMDAVFIKNWAAGAYLLGFSLSLRHVIITGNPEKTWPSVSTIVVDSLGQNQKELEDEAERHLRPIDLLWMNGCV